MNSTEMKGIVEEFRFWKGFVKTQQFADWVSDKPTPELRPYIVNFIRNAPKGKVLDVGSGAVSILNGLVPRSNLVSADPLSGLYEEIFDYTTHKIAPPLPVSGEDLSFVDMFDIVHMSNALDHSQDPEGVFKNLVAATKPGGYTIIQCFEKEATHQKSGGFHQWDMILESSRLIVSKEEFPIILGEADVHSNLIKLSAGRNWIIWIRRKGD